MSNHAARMVADYTAGNQNSFIGAGSPTRGLTGEAYLLSIHAGGGSGSGNSPKKRRPMRGQFVGGAWER